MEASRDVSCINRKKSDNKIFKKCIPKLLTNRSKIDEQIVQKSFKIEPRSPRTLPGSPGELREPPKSASEAPQERPRAPQERPRAPQERPRAAQERPKSAPRAPRRVPRRLSGRSREPSGTILTVISSKNEVPEGDLLRDSLEKPVRIIFWWIFEGCAQERTCEKPEKKPRVLLDF